MIKKFPKIKICIVIIISIGVFSYIFNTIYNKKISNSKTSLLIKKVNETGNNEEIYINNDINIVILYNTVMIPMDEVFLGLLGNNYIVGQEQEIVYDNMNIKIDLNNNVITINEFLPNSTEWADNSVKVEIEEEMNKKYIPIYLISNLPNTRVKLDNKYIYQNSNYISSIDAYSKNSVLHQMVIETNIKNEEESFSYIGQNNGALWREEAYKRIEKYRKKNTKLLIKNQNQLELNNSNITINMQNNEFKLGTAIRTIDNENDYTGINRNKFNLLGSENYFKWWFVKNEDDIVQNNLINYAKDNNYVLRGHNLWWDYIYASELRNLVGNSTTIEEGTMAYVYYNYNNNNIDERRAEELCKEIEIKFEDIVLNHIKEEVRKYNYITEWDVVNGPLVNQYFKYYLYDRKLLNDYSFLTKSKEIRDSDEIYVPNENYCKFIAKCFDTAKKYNPNSKLILNDNIITGKYANIQIENITKLINSIKKYTNNIDGIGIQNHVYNSYSNTPQSYYNHINDAITNTGLKEAVLTEYDNFTSSRIGKYTKKDKETKADYLRDTLIVAYSNPNITEFCFWVYNSKKGAFEDEERQAYEEFATPLLNYTESGTSDENGYSTRLYKGEYEATIKLKNGKEKTVNFTVSDDSSDTVEVVFESDVEKIEIKQQPSKTEFYQNEDIDFAGGKLTVYYDDDTTYEIDLTDKDVHINGYDSSKLGKQKITIEYQGKETKLEVTVVENVDEIVKDNANNIIKINQEIKNNNSVIFSDKKVSDLYDELISSINNFANNSETRNQNTITEIYNKQIELAETIFDEYKSEKLENVESETVINVVKEIINITDEYSKIFSYYVSDDNIQINPDVMETINLIIEKYNSHTHVDIRNTTELVEKCRDLYNNSINTESISNNYLNKLRIINTCEIISKIIDYDICLDDENKIKNNEIYTQNNNLIRNIDVNTTPNTLINNLKISDSHKVYRNNEELEETSSIATGDILKVNNNTYVLIVKGDIDGNGVVNVADLVKYRKYLLELDELKDLEVYAADTNLDNQLKVGDLVGIRKIILNN